MVEKGYSCECSQTDQMVRSHSVLLTFGCQIFIVLKSELLFQNHYHIYYVSFYLSRWYAKRFLHPDIVAPYDYIFIWDEDLGVEHFNAEE
jgi:hypothetical protein